MDKTKTVFQCNSEGIYFAQTLAHLSPLDKDEVWLIPAGCVEKAPPEFDDSKQYAQWTGTDWVIKDIPPKVDEIEKIDELSLEDIEKQKIEDEIQTELRTMALERLAQRAKQ